MLFAAAASRARWARASSAERALAWAIRSSIGARQQWQIASASASAASAGRGASASASSRVTMAVTCALPARPSPVTAALTSLGVWKATGSPARAASSATTPDACAVPITVRTFCWLKTRSIATDVGPVALDPLLDGLADGEQPPLDRHVGGAAHDVDGDAADLPPAAAVDHAEAAPGQPRVDAEHPHPPLPPRTVVRWAGYRRPPGTRRGARRADADFAELMRPPRSTVCEDA